MILALISIPLWAVVALAVGVIGCFAGLKLGTREERDAFRWCLCAMLCAFAALFALVFLYFALALVHASGVAVSNDPEAYEGPRSGYVRMREYAVVPKDAPGGMTIDVFAEWGKERDRARKLERAAQAVIDAQDAELMADGSIRCLRYVNTHALKGLIKAVQSR